MGEEERAAELRRNQAFQSIRVLARAVDAKDPSTRRHSERVAGLAAALAEACGWAPERVALLHEAALVHDVGKIAVSDAILFKPERLTEAEMVKVQPARGARRRDALGRAHAGAGLLGARPPRALGRRRATRTGSPARPSPRAPASSTSPTPGT